MPLMFGRLSVVQLKGKEIFARWTELRCPSTGEYYAGNDKNSLAVITSTCQGRAGRCISIISFHHQENFDRRESISIL